MAEHVKPVARVLARLGCERLLIFVAEKDHLMVVSKNYNEKLKKKEGRGRGGVVLWRWLRI